MNKRDYENIYLDLNNEISKLLTTKDKLIFDWLTSPSEKPKLIWNRTEYHSQADLLEIFVDKFQIEFANIAYLVEVETNYLIVAKNYSAIEFTKNGLRLAIYCFLNEGLQKVGEDFLERLNLSFDKIKELMSLEDKQKLDHKLLNIQNNEQ